MPSSIPFSKPPWKAPQPKFHLLFSPLFAVTTPRSEIVMTILLAIPAIILSIASGLLTPYMTLLIGTAFSAFAKFPILPLPSTADQRSALKSTIGTLALQLIGMGFAMIALNGLMTALWVWISERIVKCIRRDVFDSIGTREMAWFDLGMGISDQDVEKDETINGISNKEGVGAAGLMSKFTRETEDVRIAAGTNIGQLISAITTFISCFILSLTKSWSLTLVILAAIPLVLGAAIIAQKLNYPNMTKDRRLVAALSKKTERAVSSIATVKAFNAQEKEKNELNQLNHTLNGVENLKSWVWGINFGFTGFIMSSMFVSGFWYGSALIRQGKTTSGDVLTVFFATVLAASSLQACMPIMVSITKGKGSIASLMTIINPPPSATSVRDSGIISLPRSNSRKRVLLLQKIKPAKCYGEFILNNVSFAYPSRPTIEVLKSVTMFLPARETTFIVGGSGSGKSTLAQLLLRMYQPSRGDITFDDQYISQLDPVWLKNQVASVQQGCILFDDTVHNNIAMGLSGHPHRKPEDATRDEVISACRTALMHDFVRDLPDGYDTRIGTGGYDLSGGQMQRLAIARAVIRDPEVLILDECTSALDSTSRILVFEAIRKWRQNKTTVVITHDLSQILPEDFVYLLKNGFLAEEGYRADLMKRQSLFYESAREQNAKEDESEAAEQENHFLPIIETNPFLSCNEKVDSHYRDSVLDYYDDDYDEYNTAGGISLHLVNTLASRGQLSRPARSPRNRFNHSTSGSIEKHSAESAHSAAQNTTPEPVEDKMPSIFATIIEFLPSLPMKSLWLFGIITAIGHGIVTPLWSSYLSKLMNQAAVGGTNARLLTLNACIVLALSALDGFCIGTSFIALDLVSFKWGSHLRTTCFNNIMKQDKGWFDKPENSGSKIAQLLGKDVEDMHSLASTIPGQTLTVIAMVVVGIIWAAVLGWEMTAAGVALIPIIGILVAGHSVILNKIETKNKKMREDIGKTFFDNVANMRGIRAMSLESIFVKKFEADLRSAYHSGIRGSWAEGVGLGLVKGLIYFCEALMFYIIAILMVKGKYTYAQSLEVFTLIIFSLTYAAQSLNFIPSIAKANRAAQDFRRLLALSKDPVAEAEGDLRYTITGQISFRNVSFSYPTRPSVKVLDDVTFDVFPGEMVAIVGASGSGKSTIAALLQRLYEPSIGNIFFGKYRLGSGDVKWLREHISIVSQTPSLFDASVTDNITYGSSNIPFTEVVNACKAANVHDFILSLPQGYETKLGENAGNISGGQAQRLCIARSLLKGANILLLDEFTSALDSENQMVLLDTVTRVRTGRTVFMITHKLPAMQICSRILVVSDGKIVEDGTYDELIQKKGVFADLTRGGEWE